MLQLKFLFDAGSHGKESALSLFVILLVYSLVPHRTIVGQPEVLFLLYSVSLCITLYFFEKSIYLFILCVSMHLYMWV